MNPHERGRRAHAGAENGRLVWVVQSGEEGRLRGALDRLGHGVRGALEEGRVFVDGVRVIDSCLEVKEGSRIEVRMRRATGGECSILGRRGDLIAAFKPAGVPTEPDHRGSSDSLVAQVADRLGCASRRIHAATRLDLDVSGVVLLATAPAACAHLDRARQSGAFHKLYVAIAARSPSPLRGTWETPLPGKGASEAPVSACTHYRVRARTGTSVAERFTAGAMASAAALLELEAVTGRFHQLRRHSAGAGCALLGDARYSGSRRIVRPSGSVLSLRRVALHAACVALPDASGRDWVVLAPLPGEFADIWSACGGDASDLVALDDEAFWCREWLAE